MVHRRPLIARTFRSKGLAPLAFPAAPSLSPRYRPSWVFFICPLLADAVTIVHFLFVLFVVAGGVLVLRWPKVAWVYVPAAAWGVLVEVMGWECPLTPLEDRLRTLGGAPAAHADFVARYVLPVLYPERLTPSVQRGLGLFVVVVNVLVYTFVIRRSRATHPRQRRRL